eukprot:GHUV01001012.1.p1 GENE.GHUV01001012.1~~GHUV01001012.1.p1  ORF type:complete len:198 (+),score=33.93 GHUV01001012.1:522-1115(+)
MSRSVLVLLFLLGSIAAVAGDAAPAHFNKGLVTPRYATLERFVQQSKRPFTFASQFSTLVVAVEAADLTTTLATATRPPGITVLAPTNQAFEKRLKLLNLTAEALLADKPLLRKILSYHVIPGSPPGPTFSKELRNGQRVITLLGPDVPLLVKVLGRLKPRIFFKAPTNLAQVIYPDIRVNKAVFHGIDDVLIPPLS